MNNGVIFLLLAVLLDMASNVLLKKSAGFRNKIYGISAILCIVTAFFMLGQAIRTMDLSIAYALWVAAGMLLTSFIDTTFFHVKLKGSALVGILCMITGIVLIQSLD